MARFVPKTLVLALGLALGLATGGASAEQLRATALPPLPKVNPADFFPGVRDQVLKAYADVQAHPASAEANGRLGMVFQVYRQNQSAAMCYERAHRLDAKSFRWLYYLAQVEQAQGHYDRAAEYFQSALELRPDYLPAKIDRADSLLAAGHAEEAGRIYEAVIAESPENAPAHYGLGRVRAARGDWPGAAEEYRKACNLYPNYGAAHYALALADRRLGNSQATEEELKLAEQNMTNVPPVVDPLMAEVQALNRSGLAEIRVGMNLEKEGKLRESAAAHEKALELDPNLVQAHINLISIYARLGDLAKAEEHYREAIRLNPNAAEAYYDFGVLMFQEKKFSEAEAAFRKTLALNPYHPEAHNNLGFLLETQGKLDEAAEEFTKAIQNRPNYRLAQFHLGRILVNEGKYQEGIAHLLKTLTPEDQDTPTYLYALGASYARAGELEPALRYLRNARDQASARGQTQLLADIERDLRTLEARGQQR